MNPIDGLTRPSPVLLVSIVDRMLSHVSNNAYRRVLLPSIRATADSGPHQDKLGGLGVAVLTPTSNGQAPIDRMVFGELGHGTVHDISRDRVKEIVGHHPAAAVILGCPLPVVSSDLGLPVVDTLALHVEAIVHRTCTASERAADDTQT